ncbi:THAP domain-containing protein 1-like [Ruditapes philippinarum]|uniref:THAP domain-containing protein 1-like n=1 Tax=Ruditapes philippinarum TaxID=129788 RepID=UPI00295BAF29|nr:THAP domain-containing protein 1-like [Ruditapes philippinarum]
MVISCWVNGCSNRADQSRSLGFYSIPSVRENEGEFTKSLTEERRILWISNINRKDAPTKYSKICSDHFLKGKPASMYHRSDPDWAPTLNLDGAMTPTKSVLKKKKIETDSKR